MREKSKRSQKGFTLIELIIVIAILGVLAALIVPNVTGRVKSAKEGVDEANAKAIENAINQYIAESGDETCVGLYSGGIPSEGISGEDAKAVIDMLKDKIGDYGPYLSSSATDTPQQQGKVFEIKITNGEATVGVVGASGTSDQTNTP